ncbi:MAG: Crp/Fnr family transcriptional regulator [Proteobacteria bacterium]|nr:Crp/Fnr family transcriptional regulator [Pseudomonadota bacterium]
MALSVQTLLERNRLFRGLSAATIQQIGGLAVRRVYADGAIVFSQGDPGDALYGVVTGQVRISASTREGREMFLNIMEPGDTFGEIALLDGQSRTATATATSSCELMIIPRAQFLALLQREPALAIHLLQLLCQRIRWTSGWVEDSALLTVPTRLVRRLLSLANLHGRPVPKGVQLAISQEELGRFLGLSRQAVNQYLQEWRTRGWVDVGRGKVTILDEAALQGLAAGKSE